MAPQQVNSACPNHAFQLHGGKPLAGVERHERNVKCLNKGSSPAEDASACQRHPGRLLYAKRMTATVEQILSLSAPSARSILVARAFTAHGCCAWNISTAAYSTTERSVSTRHRWPNFDDDAMKKGGEKRQTSQDTSGNTKTEYPGDFEDEPVTTWTSLISGFLSSPQVSDVSRRHQEDYVTRRTSCRRIFLT